MEINMNSWHYRLIRKFGEYNIPKDLCGYVKRLLECILVTLMIICVAIFALSSMLTAIIIPILNTFVLDQSAFHIYDDDSIWSLLLPSGIICWIVGLYILYELYLSKIVKEKIFSLKKHKVKSEKKDDNIKEEKKPNIFIEWIKAKKEKMCPTLEFKE